jgi:hypothetical protein
MSFTTCASVRGSILLNWLETQFPFPTCCYYFFPFSLSKILAQIHDKLTNEEGSSQAELQLFFWQLLVGFSWPPCTSSPHQQQLSYALSCSEGVSHSVLFWGPDT